MAIPATLVACFFPRLVQTHLSLALTTLMHGQVVIAPRLTPPSVTGIKANTTGAALFSRLSTSFGYLNKQE